MSGNAKKKAEVTERVCGERIVGQRWVDFMDFFGCFKMNMVVLSGEVLVYEWVWEAKKCMRLMCIVQGAW